MDWIYMALGNGDNEVLPNKVGQMFFRICGYILSNKLNFCLRVKVCN